MSSSVSRVTGSTSSSNPGATRDQHGPVAEHGDARGLFEVEGGRHHLGRRVDADDTPVLEVRHVDDRPVGRDVVCLRFDLQSPDDRSGRRSKRISSCVPPRPIHQPSASMAIGRAPTLRTDVESLNDLAALASGWIDEPEVADPGVYKDQQAIQIGAHSVEVDARRVSDMAPTSRRHVRRSGSRRDQRGRGGGDDG